MRKQKTWYCPHYSRLPQFKRRGGTRTSAQPSMASIQAAMKLDNICICKAKPSTTETVVECHGDNCKNRKFFHLTCHSLNRMPTIIGNVLNATNLPQSIQPPPLPSIVLHQIPQVVKGKVIFLSLKSQRKFA